MAVITEKLLLEVDSAGAVNSIERVGKSLDKTSKEGVTAGKKLGQQWGKTFASYAIGASAASKAALLLVSTMNKAFTDALAVRLPGTLDKAGAAWDKAFRNFADNILDIAIPAIDAMDVGLTKLTEPGRLERFGGRLAFIGKELAGTMTGLNIFREQGGALGQGLAGKPRISGPAIPSNALDLLTDARAKNEEEAAKLRQDRAKRDADAELEFQRQQAQLASDQRMRNYALELVLEEERAAGILEIRQDNADRIADLEIRNAQYVQDEQARLDGERAATVRQVTMIIGQEIGSAFQAMLDGQEVSGRKFLSNILKNIGMMVFSKGVADLAAATASGFIYGNFAGIGPANAEMAIGATLMAGGSLIGRGAGARGGGGGERFSGGSAGGGGGTPSTGEDKKTVIINVSGAVTDAGVGVQIKKALDEASKQGLL